MDVEDRAAFTALPGQSRFAVYRGAAGALDARRGISWTTSREKAEWFARRYGRGRATLAYALVDKSAVAAVFVGRNEAEVILPRRPKGITVQKLS